MRYQLMYSNTGRNDWTPVFSPDGWKEVWKNLQDSKAANPHLTYHIFPA